MYLGQLESYFMIERIIAEVWIGMITCMWQYVHTILTMCLFIDFCLCLCLLVCVLQKEVTEGAGKENGPADQPAEKPPKKPDKPEKNQPVQSPASPDEQQAMMVSITPLNIFFPPPPTPPPKHAFF